MDVAPLHRLLLHHVDKFCDLWSMTTGSKPAAIVMFGMPTREEAMGYIVVAGKARSTLSAADYVANMMADEANAGIFDGFYGPAQHLFAFRHNGPVKLHVAGWSADGSATIGSITKPPHPEFPTEVNVLSVPARLSPIDRSHFDLTLLAQLSDVGSIVDPASDGAVPL